MSQAVFALQETPLKPFVTESGSPAPLSAPAAALRRWASVACRLGILTAFVPLIVALAYVVVVAEPLWQRLMTLVVVGLAPAVMVLADRFRRAPPRPRQQARRSRRRAGLEAHRAAAAAAGWAACAASPSPPPRCRGQAGA